MQPVTTLMKKEKRKKISAANLCRSLSLSPSLSLSLSQTHTHTHTDWGKEKVPIQQHCTDSILIHMQSNQNVFKKTNKKQGKTKQKNLKMNKH